MNNNRVENNEIYFYKNDKVEILPLNFIISDKLKNLPKKKLSEINDLQGNLKDLYDDDMYKLLYRIVKYTFKYPFYLWFDKDGKAWTLDGNQRNRVLSKFFGDVSIPYIEIYAKNKKQAKMEILAISSDYGKTTKDGFDEFTAEFNDIDFQDVKNEFTFNKWFDDDIVDINDLNLKNNAFAEQANQLSFSITFNFPISEKEQFDKFDKKELEKVLKDFVYNDISLNNNE